MMRCNLTLLAVVLFLFPCAVPVAQGDDRIASKDLSKVASNGKDIERLLKQRRSTHGPCR